MTNPITFTKMHGAGNDYIYVNTMAYPLENPEELAIRWSAPHTGIGSDGLVLIGTSEKADFSMRIFNADGSEAMMCGNASRCIGKYVYEMGLTDKETVTLETLSGIKELRLKISPNGSVNEVTVDMGIPEINGTPLELEAGGQTYTGTSVSMGNPHLVIFVNDIDKIDLPAIGPLLEHHPLFPDRTNVEFVQVLKEDEVRMRVWERGSGITQACGTGACATAVAGITSGKTKRKTKVIMDGGPLTIQWDESSGKVFMTGEAVTVFEGTIKI
ncbi:diaminopimelate epimerase [Parabacteroides gordonii]|uniref:Diaminopimelate epimerase n=1 Tax=Parabacteroides gordonii MS-1 = DSM 23371 TaxID=1203610 RepID=A0A0F5IPM1_9BACT|nr:diaminopimelate epimerase [Parabacteroides gordonii]KKB47491.1 diaminopimelate epimerase [Parabacteroides gordonii MS-1 = DSM 23371]MCA5584595.1 diaminopimelate epimerase [Parabacteroides gordonii]